jgi:energy-coupling factor transport system permease protein
MSHIHGIGLFVPGDGWLYRIDPRVKLLVSLLLIILSVCSESILFHAATSIILCIGFLSLRLKKKELLRFTTPLFIVVAITFVLHLIFSDKNGTEIGSIIGLHITQKAILTGILYSLRVVLFFFAATLFTVTVSPSELADAVSQLLRPLGALKVPVEDLGLILFMSMRFVPVLYEEFTAILYAQKVRGVNFSGGMMSRIKNSASVVTPLLISVTQRADTAAIALKTRGYQSGITRTHYAQRAMQLSDWLALLGFSGLFIALFLFSIQYAKA